MNSNLLISSIGLIYLTGFPALGSPESAQSKMHSGVSSYKQQEYDEALTLFDEAREEEPQNPELSYNLANSQFKSGHFPEALQTYNQSYTASTDPKLQRNSLYNMGNTHYRMGKLEEAIEIYKRALEIDSGDMDAKFNLEFVREQLKKQQQSPKNNRKQNSGSSHNTEQETGGPNPPDPNQEESAKEQNKKSTDDQQNQNGGQPNKVKQTQQETMSPQEAEQWLRALRENTKLLSRMQRAEQGRNPPYLGKNW